MMDSDSCKPLIIYVTGAPGSGKTTLAKLISEQLYIPHVSSDLVHGGAGLVRPDEYDRRQGFHEAFVPLMMAMARLRISFVVDQVLQKDISKTDIIDKLTPWARIVYVHTMAGNSIERHLARELTRRDKGVVLDEGGLKKRAEFHASNLAQTEQPADYESPVLVVRTEEGYEPSLEKIIDFIQRQH